MRLVGSLQDFFKEKLKSNFDSIRIYMIIYKK